MNVSLAPIVVRRLAEFRARRTRLVWLRSLAAAVVVFVVAVALVAAVDAITLLDDSMRWRLSAAAYASAALTGLTLAAVRLRRPLDETDDADAIEAEADTLREKLRSAVDLAVDDDAIVTDSRRFRGLLQSDVAETIETVPVGRLLPLRLIGPTLVVAVVTLAAAAAALLAGGDPVRRLALRAILPGANVARVSEVRIELLRPLSPSEVRPRGEAVGVVVAVDAGLFAVPGDVTLERRLAGSTTTQPMAAVADAAGDTETNAGNDSERFAATLPLDAASVDFRIRAGDAVTKWFTIPTQPRPSIKRFAITYRPPTGLDRKSVTVEQPDGSLTALVGSSATLRLTPNGPVDEAAVVLRRNDKTETIPLTAEGSSLIADVPIAEPGQYFVQMTDPQSGFESDAAITHSVTPIVDPVPVVRWVAESQAPPEEPPIVLLDDAIAIEAVAFDNLPELQLKIETAIGTGPWRATAVDAVASRPAADDWLVERPSPLQQQLDQTWQPRTGDARPGDLIKLKVTATDWGGQVGESTVRTYLVADERLPDDRHRDAIELAELIGRLESIASQTTEARQTGTREAFDSVAADLSDTLDLVGRLLADRSAGTDAEDLELIGTMLAEQQYHIATAFEPSDFARVDERMKQVTKDAQSLAGHTFGLAVYRDLAALKRQQDRVAAAVEAEQDNWSQQQTITLRQLEQFEAFAASLKDVAPRDVMHITDDILRWSSRVPERIAAEASRGQLDRERRLARDLAREFGDRRRRDLVAGSIVQRIQNVRSERDRRRVRLADAVEALPGGEPSAPEASESSVRPLVELLGSLERLRELRTDVPVEVGGDLDLLARAVRAIATGPMAPPERAAALNEVTDAVATLEAGHQLGRVALMIDAMEAVDRWGDDPLVLHFEQPRTWVAATTRLDRVTQRAHRDGLAADFQHRSNQVRWGAAGRTVHQRVDERRWRETFTPLAGELGQFGGELRELVGSTTATTDAAREVLRRYVPTLEELLSQARETVEQLQVATESPDRAAGRLLAGRDRLADRVEAVTDELVRNANRRDLLDASDRAMARDADIARELLVDRQRSVEEAVGRLAREPDSEPAASEAVVAERELAAALDQLADHFDPDRSAEQQLATRDSLRNAADELGLRRQLDQQYESAERLAELAEQSTEELRDQLRAELPTNPPMQDALSEIAAGIVDEATTALSEAAEAERQIRLANEAADDALRRQVAESTAAVRDLVERERAEQQALLELVRQTIARMDDRDRLNRFDAANDRRVEAIGQAQRQGDRTLAHDAAQTAEQVATALRQSAAELADIAEQAAAAQSEPTYEDEQQRSRVARDAQRDQRRTGDRTRRDLDQLIRRREQARSNAEKQLRQQQDQLRRAEQKRDQAGRGDDRNPKAKAVRVAAEQTNVDQIAERVAKAERETKAAAARTEQARQARREAEDTLRKPLGAASPRDELLANAAAEAAENAARLADEAERLAAEAAALSTPTPGAGRLQQATTEQDAISDRIAEIAADLDRAASHEDQLGSGSAASIGEQGEQVRQTGLPRSKQAEAALTDATEAAQLASSERPSQAERETAAAAGEAIEQSEQSLRELSAAVGNLLQDEPSRADSSAGGGPAGDSSDATSRRQSTAAAGDRSSDDQSTSNGLADASGRSDAVRRGRELAELLDAVEAQLAAAQDSGQNSGREAATGPSGRSAQSEPSPTSSPSDADSPSGDGADGSDAAGHPSDVQAMLAAAAAAESRSMAAARERSTRSSPDEAPPDAPGEAGGMAQLADVFTPPPLASGSGVVTPVPADDRDWGALPTQSTNQTVAGDRAVVSEDYRPSVEAYFRALAERGAAPATRRDAPQGRRRSDSP